MIHVYGAVNMMISRFTQYMLTYYYQNETRIAARYRNENTRVCEAVNTGRRSGEGEAVPYKFSSEQTYHEGAADSPSVG
jgi:hypothetical protein